MILIEGSIWFFKFMHTFHNIRFCAFLRVTWTYIFFVLHEPECITAALLDGRQGCRHVLNTEFWLPETPWETSVWIGLCSECCVLQLTFVKDVPGHGVHLRPGFFPYSYMFSTRTCWKPTSPVKLISKH